MNIKNKFWNFLNLNEKENLIIFKLLKYYNVKILNFSKLKKTGYQIFQIVIYPHESECIKKSYKKNSQIF